MFVCVCVQANGSCVCPCWFSIMRCAYVAYPPFVCHLPYNKTPFAFSCHLISNVLRQHGHSKRQRHQRRQQQQQQQHTKEESFNGFFCCIIYDRVKCVKNYFRFVRKARIPTSDNGMSHPTSMSMVCHIYSHGAQTILPPQNSARIQTS